MSLRWSPSHPPRSFSPTAAASTATGSAVEGTALGEAVFYTGMTGYEEALTDPSYAGQILTFTYPMIGNYGISGAAAQYPRACVAGAVIKQIAEHPSHHLARKPSCRSWLDEQNMPALIGADTRAITIALREHGTIWAALAVGDAALASTPRRRLSEFVRTANDQSTGSQRRDRSARFSSRARDGRARGADRLRREARDPARARSARRARYGSAVRCNDRRNPGHRARRRSSFRRVPAIRRTSPGTVELLRELVGRKPLFGICLGHQLLALACGAKTYKLPYGHRGGNQPVNDLLPDEVLVTAHNHGYAVDAELACRATRSDDDQPQRRHQRRLPSPHAADRGGAVPSRSVTRTVRCSPHLCAMVRFAAAAARSLRGLIAAWLALLPAPAARAVAAASDGRSRSSLSADTSAGRKSTTPFHLIVTLHVRENVMRIDNLELPLLAELELLGDERETQSGSRGTQYRETITVVAHHAGTVAIAPATLQAIDARDGKPKQCYTNQLRLHVAGAPARLLATVRRSRQCAACCRAALRILSLGGRHCDRRWPRRADRPGAVRNRLPMPMPAPVTPPPSLRSPMVRSRRQRSKMRSPSCAPRARASRPCACAPRSGAWSARRKAKRWPTCCDARKPTTRCNAGC